MRLIMMRHGATAGNAERRYVGRRTDEPLSDAGRAQCARAGCLPEVRRVYVSPLLRACETARLCFPQAELVPVPGLEEFDFGAFEGRSALEMAHDEAYRAWVEGGCVDRCPGGESRASYVARSNAALAEVLRQEARAGATQVVVVAHGGTIMAALSPFAQDEGDGDAYFRWQVGTCEGYVATVHLQGSEIALADCRRFSALSSATAEGVCS